MNVARASVAPLSAATPPSKPYRFQGALAGKDELVAAMWGEGLSAGQIAKRLGCTKSTVLGNVHRARKLGCVWATSRAPVGKPPKPPKKQRAPKPAPVRVVRDDPPAEQPAATRRKPTVEVRPSLGIRVPDLEPHHCRAVTDTTPFNQRFCGHEKAEGSPYCPEHTALFSGSQVVRA